MKHMRRWFIPVSIVLAVNLASACSAESPPPAPQPPRAAPITPPLYRVIYDSGPAARSITTAQQTLITQCMEHHGFTYSGAASSDWNEEDRPRPFGFEVLPHPAAPVTELREPVVPGGYALALFGRESARISVTSTKDGITAGRPGEGCMAEVEHRMLGGSTREFLALRVELYGMERRATAALEDDVRLQVLDQRWQACMKPRGVQSPSPFTFSRAYARAGQDRPALIATDLRCKEEVDYLSQSYALLAQKQDVELQNSPEVLARWTRYKQHQLLVAESMVRAGASSRPR